MASVEEHFGDADWFLPREDSEASIVFKAMTDVPEDGTLTYDDLDRVLGRDFKTNRGPWNDALRRWHRDMPQGGTWRCIHRVGYQRVTEWGDVKGTGVSHEQRMRRQAKKSRQRYVSADQSLMTDEQKQEQSSMITRIGKLEAAMRSTKAEIKVLKRTKADTSDVDILRDQVAALTEIVTKLSTDK